MLLYGKMFTSEIDMQHVKKIFTKSIIFWEFRLCSHKNLNVFI